MPPIDTLPLMQAAFCVESGTGNMFLYKGRRLHGRLVKEIPNEKWNCRNGGDDIKIQM
jgi:hypothetical protein